MREIKFRAWVKNEDLFGIKTKEKYPKGHMFIGFGLSDIDKGYDEANAWCENDRWEEPDFEKAVIMQFTGLKDKNGKEIYESDLVKGQAEEVKPIVYSEGSFCWDDVSLKEWDISNWEVVGNIYEN